MVGFHGVRGRRVGDCFVFFDFCICVGILELCILLLVEDRSEVEKSLAGGLYCSCLMWCSWDLCGLL